LIIVNYLIHCHVIVRGKLIAYPFIGRLLFFPFCVIFSNASALS